MCENQSSVMNDGIAAIESSVSCIKDLCALFGAIKTASTEHTNEHNLSHIGGNLAEEWACVCEYEVNEVKGEGGQETEFSKLDSRSEAAKLTDAIAVCHSSIHDLSVLFDAIRDTTDKHTKAYDLAGIGWHLADQVVADLEQGGDEIQSIFGEVKKPVGISATLPVTAAA